MHVMCLFLNYMVNTNFHLCLATTVYQNNLKTESEDGDMDDGENDPDCSAFIDGLIEEQQREYQEEQDILNQLLGGTKQRRGG